MNELSRIHALASEIQEQGFTAVCFSFPSYATGGGNYYFGEMARYLSINTDLHIYYLDYSEGTSHKQLEGTNVTILDYNMEDTDFPVKEKCIVVTNTTRAIQLKKMRPDNKLLFWHYETVPCAWEVVFIMEEGKSFLELCRQKHAVVFHDWSSWDILSRDCGNEYEKKKAPENAGCTSCCDDRMHGKYHAAAQCKRSDSGFTVTRRHLCHQQRCV